TFADVDAPVFRDLDEVQVRDEVLLLRRRTTGPFVAGNRLVRDLAERHPMAAPAAFVGAGRRVIDEHALLVYDVVIVGHLVELEAALIDEIARLLIVLRQLGLFRRRTMIEVPYQFAVAGELQDAVLIAFAGDPDEALRIDNHRLQRAGPLRV